MYARLKAAGEASERTKTVNGFSNNAPIGVYDSGLGGLTVWREIRRALPGESLAYLGDGANCPYGSRPREEVQALADAAVARLVELGCKMVVVACNTATAAAIDFLREKYAGVPIVGMEPAVKPACLATRSGVVGVLALCAYPFLQLGIQYLLYKLTAFLASVFGDTELCGLNGALGGEFCLILGMVGSCALVLLGMCALFTVFGLLVYYPARRLNAAIAASKEKSGIM